MGSCCPGALGAGAALPQLLTCQTIGVRGWLPELTGMVPSLLAVEPDNGRSSPGCCSGLSSPREQSFTSRRGGRQQQFSLLLGAGRGSLDLQRPGSTPQPGSPDALRPGGVRRGLDLRFNAAASGGSGG